MSLSFNSRCTTFEVEKFIKKVLLALTFNKLDHRNYNLNRKANFKDHYKTFIEEYNGSFDLMISSKAAKFILYCEEDVEEDTEYVEEAKEEIKQMLWSNFVKSTEFTELESLHPDAIDDFVEELYNIIFNRKELSVK